ncbi:MAG: thioredoxin family protein [Rhodocyclales bacterium]|nr:thioredoxin family protein [Rhodocyclales bacterium]
MARMIRLLTTLLLCAAASVHAASPLFDRHADDLAHEAALAQAEGKALAVLFESSDCTFCAQMKRQVFPVRSVVSDFGARFRTVAVAVDSDAALIAPDGTTTTAAALAARLRLAGTPAFAFYDGKGALLTRHQGAFKAAADLAALGRYVATGAYETLPFQAYRTQGKIAKTAANLPDCRKSPTAIDCVCTTATSKHL